MKVNASNAVKSGLFVAFHDRSAFRFPTKLNRSVATIVARSAIQLYCRRANGIVGHDSFLELI